MEGGRKIQRVIVVLIVTDVLYKVNHHGPDPNPNPNPTHHTIKVMR